MKLNLTNIDDNPCSPSSTFMGMLRYLEVPVYVNGAVRQLYTNEGTSFLSEVDSSIDVVFAERSHHLYHSNNVVTEKLFSAKEVNVHGYYNFYNTHNASHVYFPFYFAEANIMDDTKVEMYSRSHPNFASQKKQFLVSCVNRRPTPERLWLYALLHQQPFYNQSVTSIYPHLNGADSIDYDSFLTYSTNISSPKTYNGTNPYDYFVEHIKHKLPICTEEDLRIYQQRSDYYTRNIDHPAFSDSYLNIISEHSYEAKFITEKTVKPIAAGQLFLMVGPCGAIQHLRELGFDTFDDLIDHAHYDNEPDVHTRLIKMFEVGTDVFKSGIEQMYIDTYHRREANIAYLFGDELRQIIYEPIRRWIINEIRK